jgi:uncharacterized protein
LIPFLDTSALIKRYVEEPGSAMVRALLRRDTAVVCRVAFAELSAAIARAAREGVVDERRRDAILARLDGDFSKFTIVEVRRAMLAPTPRLVVDHALRGYDAVQLAAAIAVHGKSGAVSFLVGGLASGECGSRRGTARSRAKLTASRQGWPHHRSIEMRAAAR